MSRFLQFGTSRFLQAHADLFIAEGLGSNQICVVQSSGNAERTHRVAALAAESGYVVRIRGFRNNEVVDTTHHVRSIEKAISTATDWPSVCDEFLKCEYVMSNVSEKGYVPTPYDRQADFDNRMSFPAKLHLLLKYRYLHGGEPLTLMPLELYRANGKKLRGLIVDHVVTNSDDERFIDWLSKCVWVNSLVDRIVSEPIEPAGAVAEPYALWAIEDCKGLSFPFEHPSIVIVADLTHCLTLKLYLLNLCHSYMAQVWLDGNLPANMNVREYVSNRELYDDLQCLQQQEILPAFATVGREEEAAVYTADTMDRFRNPFLDHRFTEIIAGHAEKVENRARSFIDWASGCGDTAPKPRLTQLLRKATAQLPCVS